MRPATTETFQLAEGLVWDGARQRLLWVDIYGGLVLEGVLEQDRIEVVRRHSFDGMVGAVIVAGDGTLLVAAQEHLVVLNIDGTRREDPPPGVGMGLSPQVWLQPGDVMELGIQGLGAQRQHVVGPR